MKKTFSHFSYFTLLLLLVGVNSIAQTSVMWNKKNAALWFDKHAWTSCGKATATSVKYDQFGRTVENAQSDTSTAKTAHLSLQKLKPHKSIDKVEFAKQYHDNERWWCEAFAYLEKTDLTNLKPGKHPIDGDNVFATVVEGAPKQLDSTKWESHKNYIDIHYIIKGKEKIGVTPVASASIVNDYDAARDIMFYKGEGTYYTAEPGTFYIFFPKDAHRPNLKPDIDNVVKRIVVKVRVSGT